jgi:hypothetical protein
MMSYLEGDSLLRDIQKSLGNEELEEEMEDEEEERLDRELDEDADALIEGVVTETSFKKEPLKSQSSQVKSGSFTRPSSSMTYHT